MNKNYHRISQKIIPILQKHKVKKAGLFGSVVRDDFSDESDIDLLVDLSDDLSYLDVIGIKQELQKTLGRSVDLVEYDSIRPRLKQYILPEEVRIYEQT